MNEDEELVTIIFDIWGQRSSTTFEADAELTPLRWLRTCYDKGFLYPVEMLRGDVVVADKDELVRMISE